MLNNTTEKGSEQFQVQHILLQLKNGGLARDMKGMISK